MKKLIFLLAILIALFVSSSQTYEEQSLIPQLREWLPNQPLEEPLSKLEIPYWGRIISIEERGYYNFVEFLIRKGAHVVSFGALAAAIYWVLPKFRFRIIAAFGLTVTCAFLDEFHQSLTGGRTPTMHDVALDSAGAAIALTIIWLVKKRKHPSKK